MNNTIRKINFEQESPIDRISASLKRLDDLDQDIKERAFEKIAALMAESLIKNGVI